jgi:hypothetical protein
VTDYTKINGVAAADIVKIDGVAIADVEKVDGATKPSGAAIDWTESLWYEDNLSSILGDWSDGNSERSFQIDDDSKSNMDYTLVPFIDDSGGTKYLKFCATYVGSGSRNRFLEVDEGTRLEVNGGSNPDICGYTDTGIAFNPATGNLVDGQHVLKIGYRYVPAKGSTLYRRSTYVMDCTSNVIKCVRRTTNNTGSGVAYYTAASALSAPSLIDWIVEYDQPTNTWSNVDVPSVWPGTGLWHRLYPGDGNMSTGPNDANDGIEKKYTTYYVDADTDEHRIWYFKSG